jgi:hypothetical protein
MAIRTELNIRLANSPGALGALSRVLQDEHVNIAALMLERSGQLRMVVDNHVRAAAVLRERHHQVTEQSVLMTNVPDAPGGLVPLLTVLSESGVNLEYAYGASGGTGSAIVVLGVDDAMRAGAAAGL